MKYKCVYSFVGFVFLCSYSVDCQERNKGTAEPKWVPILTVEQNVANYATPFKTNKEFPFLDELAKSKSVIMLGECGHIDLTTSETIIHMIQYLKGKGFTTLAKESIPFLTSYLLSNFSYIEVTKKWSLHNIARYDWAAKNETRLFEMIKNNELKLWGIDVTFGVYDIAAALAILTKHSMDIEPLVLDWNLLNSRYSDFFVSLPTARPFTVAEQYELMRMIDSISNYTQYIISEKGKNNDLLAVLQWIRNLNSGFSRVGKFVGTIPDAEMNLHVKSRDYQMAENVNWFAEHFPDQKMIVWSANFHHAKDISQTTYPSDSLFYFIHQTAGESVYNKLKEKLYSLAFISLNYGNEEKGILEQEIDKITHSAPFAFVDFESLRFVSGFRDKEFDCAVIRKKKGKWLYIFDGLYYIKNQEIYIKE